MSGVGSCAAGGRTESPTAMMRIAKIADDDGGVDGGALDAGAGGITESGTDGHESRAGRGGGGSLRGRGGEAIGRGALELAFAAPVSPADSAGSEGIRAALALLASPVSGIEGFERRRIGGGWLSGATGAVAPVAPGSAKPGLSNVSSPDAENEIVGAIGAFSALAEASRSGPSPGGREGGADAAPESRFGLGGGASLRGGVESCVPAAGAISSTPFAEAARAALSLTESAEADASSGT